MRMLLAAILLALTAFSPAGAQANSKPDIVVFMVDDLGAIDERILTRLTNIRSLFLEQGLRFDEAYSETPLCCPGRASFLTGQHTAKHGVKKNRASLLNPASTIAVALNNAGYFTAFSGKYMNHQDDLADRSPQGWDKVAMLRENTATSSTWWVNDAAVSAGYMDRFATDKAQDFLDKAPADAPVFMWLTPRAPHWGATEAEPWMPRIEARYQTSTACDGISPWKPPTYAYNKKPEGFPLRHICKSLLTVDDMVGETRDHMTALGRNPIYVFMSDNGMAWGRDGFPLKNVPQAGRFPLYFSGPGIVQGSTSALVSNIDIAPTLTALAGTTMPDADGLDFANVLQGAQVFRESMREDHPLGGYTAGPWRSGWWGVRTPEWHLLKIGTRPIELYHLPSDPWEENNVASEHPDMLDMLQGDAPARVNKQ